MRVPTSDRLFNRNKQPFISTFAVVLIVFILIGVWVIYNVQVTGLIQPIGLPTPEPTRNASSYVKEAQAYFLAGNLNQAISAYEDALTVDPNNVEALIELARLQTYSASLQTPQEKRLRLTQALDNINRAVELDEFNAEAHAVRTLVLDWNAGAAGTTEEWQAFLSDAQQASVQAVNLDNRNALALAYRAEVLADQLQFTQALQLAELALSLEPNAMDTHRVYAYIMESTGNYSKAIDEYKLAADIMPNLTFLYINIGVNYRQLQLYDLALEYFDKAATINETLGITDPTPYISISKTYVRQGEFFVAARNVEKAIDFSPQDADIYGQLGVIRFRSRNYEGSIPAFQCALEGCTVYWDAQFGVYLPDNFDEVDPDLVAGMEPLTVVGLPIDNSTVVYYYTYGSVLAALNFCDDAVRVLNQVRDVYFNDPSIMAIVNESLFICS